MVGASKFGRNWCGFLISHVPLLFSHIFSSTFLSLSSSVDWKMSEYLFIFFIFSFVKGERKIAFRGCHGLDEGFQIFSSRQGESNILACIIFSLCFLIFIC